MIIITGKYDHDTGHIESMRHVVTSVLQDSIKKRGIDKVINSKMRFINYYYYH